MIETSMNTPEVCLEEPPEEVVIRDVTPLYRVIVKWDKFISRESSYWLDTNMGGLSCRYIVSLAERLIIVLEWDVDSNQWYEEDCQRLEAGSFNRYWDILCARGLALLPEFPSGLRYIYYDFGTGWERWILVGERYDETDQWLIVAFDDELMALQYKLSLS